MGRGNAPVTEDIEEGDVGAMLAEGRGHDGR